MQNVRTRKRIKDEAEVFYIATYEAIQQIPYGKVTTYGYIAKIIGAPANSRQVGAALKYLKDAGGRENEEPGTGNDNDETDSITKQFNNQNVPWWRVVAFDGRIALRTPRQMSAQRARLEDEGVTLIDDRVRQQGGRVGNLAEQGWFPDPEDSDEEE
ncbi:hypothetical protein V1514DRAFT_334364 [Lipomyces japonicus]|uniref:uncharacterized protein n=1 Tax=Lipomyces japonicus TaxID=56871 RepID=UPI0034D016C1